MSERRQRRPIAFAVGVCVVLAALALAIAPRAASASEVPCRVAPHGHHICDFYPPGDGFSGGSPIQDASGRTVGYFKPGPEWIVCQQPGAEVVSGPYRNHWWGYTLAANMHRGWVNAVWAEGGDNDAPFGPYNVPRCPASVGPPPRAAGSPPPTPTPTPTPRPTPTPTPTPAPRPSPADVPCHPAGHGHYDCSFYPRGDGIHGGAPVVSSAGHRLGYLNEGTNWVACQASGAETVASGNRNRWWAYTTANDGRRGWVSAVWAHGGTDDAPFGGVPRCRASVGAPPRTARHLPRPPRPTPTSGPSCPRYEIIGARGSGEGYVNSFGMGKTVGPAAAEALGDLPRGSTDVWNVPYPAVSLDYLNPTWHLLSPIRHGDYEKRVRVFFDSMSNGTELIIRKVRSIVTECPRTRIALIGYSQGAGAASEAVRSMSTADRGHIVSLVMWADVYSAGRSPYDETIGYEGRSSTREGHGIFGPRDIPLAVSAISDICFDVDPVCSWSGGPPVLKTGTESAMKAYLALIAHTHSNYKSWGGGTLLRLGGELTAQRLLGR